MSENDTKMQTHFSFISSFISPIALHKLYMPSQLYRVPERMKAFCYGSVGRGHFKWCESTTVPPIRTSEVLVKVAGSSVNHMDYFSAQIPPFRMMRHNKPGGFDLSGTIVKVGDSVQDFKLGDRVFGFGPGFAEYTKTLPRFLAKVPDLITDLSSMGVYPGVGVTALQILNKSWFKRSFPHHVKRLVIIGASGGVGSSLIQLVKAKGDPDVSIIAVSSGANKHYCMSIGANEFVDYTGLNGVLSSAIPNNSVDLIIDTVSGNIGTPDYVKDGLTVLNSTGLYVATNSMHPTDYLRKLAAILAGGPVTKYPVELFFMNPLNAQADLAEIARLVAENKFKLEIQRTVLFDEEEMREALVLIERRHQSGKTKVLVSED